ncbi:MAG: carbon starvation protein A [Tepidisphaeraceae bacterium]
MPLMIAVLCCMAIAYRFYSAFIAAKVLALNDANPTPSTLHPDAQNFHPTSKWVLFGHHFAAISGAGPLIGPVLAAQFGYLPGLLWIVIGVCLAGAVQDFVVLAMSTRSGGRSLAQIGYDQLGRLGGIAATVAILFIIVIALAGLGKVVVKALGGEEVKYPAGSKLVLAEGSKAEEGGETRGDYRIPGGSTLVWPNGSMKIIEGFILRSPSPGLTGYDVPGATIEVPATARRVVQGSAWGLFTIAATIPIALLVGLWMYKIRPGHVVEASAIGAVLTLAATVAGGWLTSSEFGRSCYLSANGVTIAMAIYGFVASVLPVWILLAPRDYLSSFLKIGTIALLVGGVIVANPKMEAPAINHAFLSGGPTVAGKIFPFLFITVMCGSISGFHALVSSGTTPKMIMRESHARTIGYGAMLIEGLVAVVAMIAAASLPIGDYYAMNTDLGNVPKFHDKFLEIGAGVDHLPVYEQRTEEVLRGRTGGAVTLAVGMAQIFDNASQRVFGSIAWLWKYWYHFAIMFEALFILTTIDAGTRIGRFLLQEAAGTIHPKLGDTKWWPGAIVSSALIVAGWAWFMNSGQFAVIWAIFGIANQLLAVLALCIATVWLVNTGRERYAWVTLLPMVVVATTTSTAAVQKLLGLTDTIRTQWSSATPDKTLLLNSQIQWLCVLAMLLCGAVILMTGAVRMWKGMKVPAPQVRAQHSYPSPSGRGPG